MFESVHVTKEGREIPVEISASLITYQGEPAILNVARDITERKQMEENLRKREEHYKAFFDKFPEAITVTNLNGTIQECNQRTVDLYDFKSKDEVIGTNALELIAPKDRNRAKKTLEKTKEQGRTSSVEYTCITANGEKFPVETSASVIQDSNGTPISLIAITKDITERKKAEEKLEKAKYRAQKAKEEWRRTFDHIPDIVALTSPDYEFLRINESGAESLDMEVEELLGKKCYRVIHDQEEPIEACPVEEVLKTKKPALDHEFMEDGRYYLASATPILNEQGEVEALAYSLKDITEQKQAEERLEMLHTWARKLSKPSSMDEIFTYTLDAMEKALGFKHAIIQLKKGDNLKITAARGFQSIPEKLRDLPLQGKGITIQAATTGHSVLVKNVAKHPDYLRVTPSIKAELAVPIERGGEVLGVLNVESEEKYAFDQQDQRLLETLASHVAVAIKELREKQKRVSLQRLDKLRNQFLAMAAHEINTPLTPIKSNLEMLQRGYFGELTGEQEGKIKETLESVDRMIRLVNDFRRISKLRTEQITVNMQKHHLADTIKKALAKYKHAIKEENLQLIKHIEQPVTAVYDEDRLVQVLRNLVENAIDYTEDTIWIETERHGEHIQVSVRDNGPGVPEDEQAKIFQPFYRVKEDRSREERRFGGTGLGLNICKRIVEAHGGDIQVDSKRGEGSTFTVILPRNRER